MTSALRPSGSTRAWRRIAARVLARDGYRCAMLRDGHPCGARATTVQHVQARAAGGDDRLSNLVAACAPCNYGERRPDTAAAPVPGKALRLTPRQLRLVALLDAAGLDTGAGRRRALTVLAGAAVSYTLADVDAACRWRRARGPITRM